MQLRSGGPLDAADILAGGEAVGAEVAGRISATHTNIDHVRVDTEGDASALIFRVKVRDRKQLAQVVPEHLTLQGIRSFTYNRPGEHRWTCAES